MCNARCLTEGIDVPAIDLVCFADPKQSRVDIIQAIGRALRKSAGKDVATIVVPVFIDKRDKNPEATLDDSSFKIVSDVLRVLRSYDEDLAEQIDEFRRQLGRLKAGRKGRLGKLPKTRVELPDADWVGADFIRAFEAKIIEMTSASWEEWFGMLEQYVAENHDANVPMTYTVFVNGRSYKLGSWVREQRQLHGEGVLQSDRECRLEELGFEWEVLAAAWDKHFRLLEEYVAENDGDANVGKTYTVDVNGHRYNLGAWAGTQRRAYAEGDLSPDRINRLEALGFKWNTKEAQWEKHFHEFQDYIQHNGHAPTQSCALGVWANNQRRHYGMGNLSPDRIRRLEEIGFEWRVKDARWDKAFRQVQEFAALHGYFPGLGDPGGVWVSNQRASYRKGALSLSPERIQRLKDLDGWVWHTADAKWDEMYGKVAEFIKHNGRLPTLKPSDGDVGRWVASQRAAQSRGRLDSDRVERLKELDGWAWHVDEAKWDKMYSRVAEFIKDNGRLPRMPFESETEGELYRWVTKHRSLHGKLDPARVERLGKLDGWVWSAHDAKWDKMYSQVVEFSEHNGRLPVESEGALGKWVSHQRDFYRGNSLSSDRIKRLKMVPGWTWNPPRGAAARRTTLS